MVSLTQRLARATMATFASGAAVIAFIVPASSIAQERKNYFNDPFLQVTAALPQCPAPEAPLITYEQSREQTHGRVERGTSCYRAGRCRLPNSYFYDAEIIPRVAKLVVADGRFANTSVWAEGQRRWVFLKGCVGTAEQSRELEQAEQTIDDVLLVINLLMVGTEQVPRYAVALPEVKWRSNNRK